MPIKIRHAFEKEYGKKKGDKIFYAWENKHGMLEREAHEFKIKPTPLKHSEIKLHPMKKIGLFNKRK